MTDSCRRYESSLRFLRRNRTKQKSLRFLEELVYIVKGLGF